MTAPWICNNFALMSLADEDAEVGLLAGALFLGAVIFTCFIEIFGASCVAAYNRHIPAEIMNLMSTQIVLKWMNRRR